MTSQLQGPRPQPCQAEEAQEQPSSGTRGHSRSPQHPRQTPHLPLLPGKMLLATFKLCAGSSYRHVRSMKGELPGPCLGGQGLCSV